MVLQHNTKTGKTLKTYFIIRKILPWKPSGTFLPLAMAKVRVMVWGGTIKRLAARASIQGTIINTPTELYEWAKSNICGIIFAFSSNEEHKKETDFLNSSRFIGLMTVPGTRNIHCVVPTDGRISVKTYSSSSETAREVKVRRTTLSACSRHRDATRSSPAQKGE